VLGGLAMGSRALALLMKPLAVLAKGMNLMADVDAVLLLGSSIN
jgi:hypothetical protein